VTPRDIVFFCAISYVLGVVTALTTAETICAVARASVELPLGALWDNFHQPKP